MAYGITVADLCSDFVLLEVRGEPPYSNDDIYLNLLKSGDDTSTVYPIDFEVGTKVYAYVEIDGLEPSTKYTAWCTYNEGNAFYECEFKTKSGKPTSFKWDIAKTSNQSLRVSASEWNAFTSKINEFLKYKGKSAVAFTKAVSAGLGKGAVVGGNHGLSEGKVISAKMMNEAVNAIASMGGDVSEVVNGTPVTAEFFNNIVDVLNSID